MHCIFFNSRTSFLLLSSILFKESPIMTNGDRCKKSDHKISMSQNKLIKLQFYDRFENHQIPTNLVDRSKLKLSNFKTCSASLILINSSKHFGIKVVKKFFFVQTLNFRTLFSADFKPSVKLIFVLLFKSSSYT